MYWLLLCAREAVRICWRRKLSLQFLWFTKSRLRTKTCFSIFLVLIEHVAKLLLPFWEKNKPGPGNSACSDGSLHSEFRMVSDDSIVFCERE